MEGPAPGTKETLEIPIFPLPNVVFFPHTLLPLHIFEPRYRQMVGDALEGDRRIGMNLLCPGWEKSYQGSPDVFPTGSLGLITEHQLLEGGKYNILLQGSDRYRVLHFTRELPYRVARVRLLEESFPDRTRATEMATELMLLFLELSGDKYSELTHDRLERLDLRSLVNTICSTLSLSVGEKQKLLETEIQVRAETVRSVLKQRVGHRRFVSGFDHLRPQRPGHN